MRPLSRSVSCLTWRGYCTREGAMRFTTKEIGKEGPTQGREQVRARVYTWR